MRQLYKDIIGGDSWKMLIPAGLYTIQNNLQYVAVSLLDAATFQVTYQLKILTTALCSVVLLGTTLGVMRWVSLLILTLGIALVQLPSAPVSPPPSIDAEGSVGEGEGSSTKLMGLVAVMTACVLSGLAGVYFEKVLKGSRKSVWTRNVQLSLFSLPPALFGVLVIDIKGVSTSGFFYGYTAWTVAAIALQALGGLLVAVVVKYADNILKGFATSISIVISCLVSVWLIGFRITKPFVLGTALVIFATFMYGKYSTTTGAKPVPANASSTLPTRSTDEYAADSDADTANNSEGIPLNDLVIKDGSDEDESEGVTSARTANKQD
ncbi:UDP-galactose transporter Gms1 [Coemansia aciculifera]|uniref:UDP-galactose transporter Gms1 n=1 Tax=Coemansia aciculifera TaxID=417176 RepID=A0ACC1LXN6_9FUNG|nr:UDP-galactose transporter Gms1 [Coemansia aciculifera]